ncbi:hypothetical protein HFD88_003035 [Aspergillus terreus]|nr:hypothetical protein HFD88_003035 [Aspergillus terreus]
MSATPSPAKRRACVACTAAKVKCTSHAANLCQRCARLGKSCTYLDLPQSRRSHRAAPSRVEVLEKKVDQLMSQLAALTRQNGPSQTSSYTPDPLTNVSGSSRDPEPDSTDIAEMLEAAQDPSHGPDPPTSSVLEGQPSIVDRGLLDEAEAEGLVASFQLDFVPKFPFVLLPSGETAARLRGREPFLFLCVVAAAMGSAHPLRKTVVEEIMKHVTLRIVTRSERNLELLCGLLVHCACLGGILSRPVTMKHDGRIDACMEHMASSERLSDRWIAPFIHIQSFLATMDEAYASMQTSANAIRTEVKYVEMRLEELSLREELWTAEPTSAVRTAMLMGIIQRGKELIHTIRNLPPSEIVQMTVTISARVCAAIGYMPTAVLTLLKLVTASTDSAVEAQVQAVVDAADYPNLVTELATALERQFKGMSAADRETDIVGSICSKMRLLARCYPYQVRAIVGNAPSQGARQENTSMVVGHANDDATVTSQAWPFIYGDLGNMFPVDDIQWDSLLSDFTGFN